MKSPFRSGVTRGLIRRRTTWWGVLGFGILLCLIIGADPVPSLQITAQPLAILLILQAARPSMLRRKSAYPFMDLLMMVVPFALLFAVFGLSPEDKLLEALTNIGLMIGFYTGLALTIYAVLLAIIALSERSWIMRRAVATRAEASSG